MNKRRCVTEWQELIDEQAASGLSQKAFCGQRGFHWPPSATGGASSRPSHLPASLVEPRVDSDSEVSARALVNHYARRWGCEASFRDTKDLRFGMGMSAIRVKSPQRCHRLFLLNAFAIVLLTLLGDAGESLGYDRHLKANTIKRRTHSLFRQGCMLYELIPNMPEERLRPLIERFAELLLEQPSFKNTFSIV